MRGISAASWADAFALHYRAKAAQNRNRRQRRREAEARRREAGGQRRQSPERLAELAGARERVEARHAALPQAAFSWHPSREGPAGPISLWGFIRAHARSGDPDAKAMLRADCASLAEPARKRARERAARRGELVRERLLHGGLISETHPMLQAFVAGTPRASRLRTGRHKGEATGTDSKLLALDDAYVETNPDMRADLRVDVDRDFPGGFAQLASAIARCGVPLPNIAVGRVDPDGTLRHPHLIWRLAKAVCFTGEGARAGPKGLWKATLAGLTAALLPIGADPGGRSNPLRMKNPVSPEWSRAILAETPYALAPDAAGYAALAPCLDLSGAWARLRAAKAARKGAPFLPDHPDPHVAGQSNGLFNHLRAFAYNRVRKHRDLGAGSMQEFAHEIAAEGLRLVPGCGARERAARRQAESIAVWAWQNCRPRPLPCATPEQRRERQAAGARAAAVAKRDATLARIAKAIQRLSLAGGRPTQAAVAREAESGLRTVRRHWQAALAAAAGPAIRVAIDKKGLSPLPEASRSRAVPEIHGEPSRTPPPAPINGEGWRGRSGRRPVDLGGGWSRPRPSPAAGPAPRNPAIPTAKRSGGGGGHAAGGGRQPPRYASAPPAPAAGRAAYVAVAEARNGEAGGRRRALRETCSPPPAVPTSPPTRKGPPAMLDPAEDPEGFHIALEREAWRIARTGSPSDAGQLVLASIAASIAATLPGASPEVQTSAVAKALLLLAQQEWDAAAHGMAALFLAGQNRLVAEDRLAGGNVVRLAERRP